MSKPDPAPLNIDDVLARLDARQDEDLATLQALLRIPSISTDSAYAPDCDRAAEWLVAHLQDLGFEATKHTTPGHPMVTGECIAHADAMTVLFYGHYDVQPVDPLALWHSDPFDPQIIDTEQGPQLRARGSSDDKGQLLTFLNACRAYRDVHGQLPINVKLIFEGEEESGSPSLVPFLEAHTDLLQADIGLICDTGLYDFNTPAILTSLRGLVGEEVILRGASKDLHSGLFGGPACNPIRVLSQILASLHDDTGRITLEGFYEGVAELSDVQRAQWESLQFDAAQFLGEVDLSTPAGEQHYSALEQIWSRPTCEINGINGGYTGEGFKTVLPAQASAKVSFRLVGEQDPESIRTAFRAHVQAHLPPDISAEFIPHGGARATSMPITHPAFEKARVALSEEWPKPAVFIGGGGSIPVAGHFQHILGLNAMLIGFARDDDSIHSPNEKYDLRSYHRGARSWVRILLALAQ